MVTFDISVSEALNKINNISDCRGRDTKDKYIIETVCVSKCNGGLFKSYLIY